MRCLEKCFLFFFRVVYEKLAEVVSEVDVAIYRHRVDELNPSIRYCAYNTGDVAAGDDLLTLRTHGDLLANFDVSIIIIIINE